MKKLDDKMVVEAIKKSGIEDKKIEKVIGTVKISLTRQVARSPERRITLNHESLSELVESLLIAVDISPSEAKSVLDNIKKTVKEQKDSKDKILKKGVSDVEEDEIEYEPNIK